jgi:uncharacterized protein
LNTLRARLRLMSRRVAAHDVVAVPSPCMSVCRMDMDTGFCEGCLRTLDEIAAWGRMDEGEKRAVWLELARRIDEEKPA